MLNAQISTDTATAEATASPDAAAIPPSDFPIISQITAAIEARPGRDYAASHIQSRAIAISLAEENGFRNLRSPEERAVSSSLQALLCGPRSAHYGWRLYRRYRQTGTIGVEAISY